MLKKFLVVFLYFSPVLVFAQWESDLRLTFDPSVSQTSANSGWCVAVQNDTVHVVWFDYRDGGDKIYYRRSTNNGVEWQDEVKLIDTAAYYPGVPIVSLAISSPHIIHIVWCDYIRNGDDEIFYKRSTDGGTTWLPDRRLTSDDHLVENDSWPSIATSGQYVLAVWHDYKWDGTRFNWDIFYKRSTNGGADWEPDQRLTSYPRMTGPPSIAATGSYVHIVWYDLGTGNAEIFYKRSTDNGLTWESEMRLTNDPAPSYMPSIGVSGSNVHVVWYDQRDGNYEVYYKRSTDNGVNWTPDTRLTIEPAESNRPSIAVSGQNLHIVWYDQRDGNYEIYYKNSTDNGTTFGEDTRLTTDPSASFFCSVAVGASTVHVVWTDERDGNREIYYKRNPTGNANVDENQSKMTIQQAMVYPNPFVGYAIIAGYENELFMVYDIAGMHVGNYFGKKVGFDLCPGIYFAMPVNRDFNSNEGDCKPLRLI